MLSFVFYFGFCVDFDDGVNRCRGRSLDSALSRESSYDQGISWVDSPPKIIYNEFS